MIPKKSDNGKAKRKSGSASFLEPSLGSANFFDIVLGSVTTKRLKNTVLMRHIQTNDQFFCLIKSNGILAKAIFFSSKIYLQVRKN